MIKSQEHELYLTISIKLLWCRIGIAGSTAEETGFHEWMFVAGVLWSNQSPINNKDSSSCITENVPFGLPSLKS